MSKKDLRTTAARYEISHNFDKSCDILIELGFIPKDSLFLESEAYDWLDNTPKQKDLDKFLNELGYDLT